MVMFFTKACNNNNHQCRRRLRDHHEEANIVCRLNSPDLPKDCSRLENACKTEAVKKPFHTTTTRFSVLQARSETFLFAY